MRHCLCLVLLAAACDSTGRGPAQMHPSSDLAGPITAGSHDLAVYNPGGGDDGATVTPGCADPKTCYTVYAHSDTILYKIDLMAKSLTQIGPFNAPTVPVVSGNKTYMDPDILTDLAVSPQGVIYVISKTNLYTADPNDGHVTLVGPVTACGQYAVAMTFTKDGTLYAGDHAGAFCQIDLTQTPIKVTTVGTGLSGGLSLSGDIVAIDDGTMYGTATSASDSSTASNNLLIKIDPTTAATTVIGKTGFKNIFGLAFTNGQVFGFTHDCTGTVVTIDPTTGVGTPFNMFPDPMPNCQESGNTGTGISFGGAGVNSMVAPGPIS